MEEPMQATNTPAAVISAHERAKAPRSSEVVALGAHSTHQLLAMAFPAAVVYAPEASAIDAQLSTKNAASGP